MKTELKTPKVNLLKSTRRVPNLNGSPSKKVAANGQMSGAKLKAIKAKLVRQGVKYCIGAYVDIHGVPKGKFVPIDHFEHFAHGSELYTGYALDGLGQAPNDDEISSVPDLDRIIQLPWRKEVAWMPADNHFHGKPYPLNSRVLLKNILARAA
jgi:glutamine synthetase